MTEAAGNCPGLVTVGVRGPSGNLGEGVLGPGDGEQLPAGDMLVL